VAYRVDRLKALGNGQVSYVVKSAFDALETNMRCYNLPQRFNP
jgi:hypothetical protein